MKWFLAVALVALCGCSVRVTGDASMLKKYDRPSETWSMESQDGSQQPTTKTEGEKK